MIGLAAFLLLLLTPSIPVVGAAGAWIALLLSLAGGVWGMLAARTNGRNINLVVIAVAIARLMLGGGLI
jgi:UPF0716 family protein affecting phage T7 exclusion